MGSEVRKVVGVFISIVNICFFFQLFYRGLLIIGCRQVQRLDISFEQSVYSISVRVSLSVIGENVIGAEEGYRVRLENCFSDGFQVVKGFGVLEDRILYS